MDWGLELFREVMPGICEETNQPVLVHTSKIKEAKINPHDEWIRWKFVDVSLEKPIEVDGNCGNSERVNIKFNNGASLIGHKIDGKYNWSYRKAHNE